MSTTLGLMSLLLAAAVVLVVSVRYRRFAGPLLVGFAIRALMAVVDATIFVLPGHPDSMQFDYRGFYQSRAGVAGTLEYIRTGAELYTWVVSVFYALFERSSLMMQGINVLFGTLIILNVGLLATFLGRDSKLARQAAWLTAFFPSLIYFSAVLLREVAVAYPLSIGVLFLAYWYRERRWWQMVVAVASLMLSMAFHSGAVAVMLAMGVWFLGSWVRSLFSQGFRNLGRNSLALIAGAAALAFVFSSGFGMTKFKRVQEGDVENLAESQTAFAKGRTAYLEDLHPESSAEVVLQTPLRLTYFLFAPFPWMLRSGADVLGVIDSIFIFYLVFRLWRQRGLITTRRESVLVLAVFASMAVTFAIGVSNYGTALRHRNKMLPLLIGAALSVPWRRAQRSTAKRARPKLAARVVR